MGAHRVGLLPLGTCALDPQSNGIAIQRSNSYLYRVPAYTLAAQRSGLQRQSHALSASRAARSGLEGAYDLEGVDDPAGNDDAPTAEQLQTTCTAREEFVQQGRDTWWITEMSTLAEKGSLAASSSPVSQNVAVFAPSFDGGAGRLAYATRGRRLEVAFGGASTVDGDPVSTDYLRFDSRYASAPREPSAITITAGADELHLDLARVRRVTCPATL